MTIRIEMLGTGSAFAKKYYNNNALMTCGDYTLLVDCGITAPSALHHLGVGLEKIDGIFISHTHADHVGGLEEIAFRMKFEQERKPDLLVPAGIRRSLWEHTLRGGLESPEDGADSLDAYFRVIEIPEETVHEVAPGFTIELFQTKHVPGKLSYCLIVNGGLLYTADTRFDRGLIRYAYHERGCRHILHDCQLITPGTVHATLGELLTLPEDIQESVLLMHYGDNMESFKGKTGRMTFMKQHKAYEFDV
ncbi:MBL fold metallo-hydrolase [Paenibacillus sp. CC-CFT747]|nr:MBL fold metallo-hydrolase [Paenibacillus sp. CC-CFT747]